MSGLLVQCSTEKEKSNFPDKKIFQDTPAKYRSNAGFSMHLDQVNEESAREQIRYFQQRGFGGVFIEATEGNKGNLPAAYVEQGKPFMDLRDGGITYLDEHFIRVYRSYLDEAKKLGMQVILYDDYHYPTGQVAGQFFQQFPELMAARLDKVEKDFKGAGTIRLPVPEGTWLGAALWNLDNNETSEISDRFKDGVVNCKVGQGNWKLMAFYLDHKAVMKLRNPGIMNYIEKEAVEKFLSISMGEKTSMIRNAILGIRAGMYEVNFVKQVAGWCDVHGISLSGHMDQEERPNPAIKEIFGFRPDIPENQHVPDGNRYFERGTRKMSSGAGCWIRRTGMEHGPAVKISDVIEAG